MSNIEIASNIETNAAKLGSFTGALQESELKPMKYELKFDFLLLKNLTIA